jgi:hypothetical protein
MSAMSQTDYDSPWKEALETYFQDFMAFFFPDAHTSINWSKGYEFLDKELQQVVRDAELGKRLVDKLVKLWRNEGEETWILVHIEVQSHEESKFAERMYVYHYRLYDRYRRKIASLAILGDEQPNWRPSYFGYTLWGCQIGFQFPVVKLMDYKEPWHLLELSRNPFAIVIMAYLKTQETRYDGEERKAWKLNLIRRLYNQGYQRQDILTLFRLIDWLMYLPDELDQAFWQEVEQYEQEGKMPYITSVERIGMRRGILQNSREAVLEVLEVRFTAVPEAIATAVNAIEDVATLKLLHKQSIAIPSLEAFQQLLEETASPTGVSKEKQ